MENDITIVIPTYNRSTILEKTFDALAHQSHPNFSVLLIDHGSTDATADVCRRAQSRIRLDYCYVDRDSVDVAIPRNVAIDRVTSRYVAFLDGDMLVPSFYVKAHLDFLEINDNTVGLGFSHGHKRPNTSWINDLTSSNIDELGKKMANDETMCDSRLLVMMRGEARGANNGRLPWMDGWANNLSLTTTMLRASGGFSSDQPYGFDDLDFSYKLYRKGYKFRYVMDGWAIEFPHSRPDEAALRGLDARGCLISYRRYRSLALESFFLQSLGVSGFGAERIFEQLSSLGRNYKIFDSVAPLERFEVVQPALLLGATSIKDVEFAYYARCDESIASTASIWSCCGIQCPLEDGALEMTVIVDIWRWLDGVKDVNRVSLLERLVDELKRTTRSSVFIRTSQKDASSMYEVSDQKLGELCRQKGLKFSLIDLSGEYSKSGNGEKTDAM